MEYFSIKGFPDYSLVRESEKDFYVESCKKGEWKRIGTEEKDGHMYMVLYNDDVKRTTRIHVLVAEMFVPNPDNKPIVHHKDFDPSNNNPSNLLWVTPSEHAQIHNVERKGEKAPMYGKLKPEGAGTQPKRIRQLDKNSGILINKFNSIHDASRETGINRGNINSCCLNRPHYKTAGGFRWEYDYDE